MKNMLKFLSDLLFPQNLKCVVCGDELNDDGTNGICDNCLRELNFIINPCPTCGDQMENENTYCLNCKKREHTYFKRHRSVFIYDGTAKRLIISAKLGGKKYLSENMSEFLSSAYKTNRFKCDAITFVPSGVKRIKERGFNIAKLLAENLGKNLNLPVVDTMERLNESHQINKDYKSRQDNIKNAFKILNNVDVKNKTILIVDDVYTTGATMNECARILKLAGAKEIFCLTLAHTPKKINNEKK